MSTNIEILDSLQNTILIHELFEKTKNAGMVWSQTSPTSYLAVNIESSICNEPERPDAYWEAILTRQIFGESESITLDVLRNKTAKLSVRSTENSELVDLFKAVERTIVDPKKNTREAIQFYQEVPTAQDLMFGPPFVLMPSMDLTPSGQLMGMDDVRSSWNRVPARGSLYEKVRQSALSAKGNTHYIYTPSNEATVSFGFDPLAGIRAVEVWEIDGASVGEKHRRTGRLGFVSESWRARENVLEVDF
jgi:hypothetical protein